MGTWAEFDDVVVLFVNLNFKEILVDFDKGVFQKVHGVPFYEGTKSDPALNNVFNEAMANLGTIEMNKLLEIYGGFEEILLLVDVGGWHWPKFEYDNFQVSFYKGIKFLEGIKQLGGDMFESVPKGDAIILKVIVVDIIVPEAIHTTEADKI
ncbi:hypothetical protein CR513_17610, partial [Mucuna pruriens]